MQIYFFEFIDWKLQDLGYLEYSWLEINNSEWQN